MDSASTWMQVVFGGLGVSVAIVAAVIAYFAWVQPHSPSGDDAGTASPDPVTTGRGTARPGHAAVDVPLGELTPTVGAGYIHHTGGDLVMPCATGESSDRQRTVEFDVLDRYTALETEVRVSKARDVDTPLQLAIFADGPEVANRTVTKGEVTRLSVSLDGRQKLRFQLTCQFPDGEITLGSPELIHR